MKILVGLILGLFAAVHTTPTVTQIPVKAEEDFVREAVTDGFIVEQFFRHSLTTQPPPPNATLQALLDPEEGSGGEPTAAPGVTPARATVPRTTARFAITGFLEDGSGSGDGAYLDPVTATTTTTTTATSTSTTSTGPGVVVASYTESVLASSTSEVGATEPIALPEESGSGSGDGATSVDSPQPAMGRSFFNLGAYETTEKAPEFKGHVTPDWIIILGFIVGVAALIMLCVAIATRDKWNAPKSTSQPQTRMEASHQPREVEMETFLHKDSPKENGKAAEYTVIPLEDLPHHYSD